MISSAYDNQLGRPIVARPRRDISAANLGNADLAGFVIVVGIIDTAAFRRTKATKADGSLFSGAALSQTAD